VSVGSSVLLIVDLRCVLRDGGAVASESLKASSRGSHRAALRGDRPRLARLEDGEAR
jgi:hypothetical protein